MNITILCVGKLKERFYMDASSEYLKRLTRYCKLDLIELKEERLPDAPSPAQIEGTMQGSRCNPLETARPLQPRGHVHRRQNALQSRTGPADLRLEYQRQQTSRFCHRRLFRPPFLDQGPGSI